MKKFLVALTLFLIAALPALAQTVPLGPRFVLPYQTVVDGTGTPIPGALLYFYSSGTNIPLATYSNPLLTTPNSNPVQANAAGVFPAIFLSGNYKIVLTDASNNQIWAADPVYGVGTGGGGGQCLSITVNPQTGTSYTLQPSDNCKLVTFNNSSAIAVSLPSPATNASYQTWSATVSDIGTGTITVTPTGASFTGTGSGTNLTVTGVAGTIATGFLVTGTGVPASTTIVSQSSGTPGGAGVYVTSQATTSSGASLTAAAAINGAATLTVLPGQAAQIISDGSNYQVILSSPAGSSISVGSTVVLNGTAGRILYQNGAVIGQYPTTGTAGSVVLSTSPTIVGPTITGSLTATGLVTNADLVNPSVTVNGTACVLGASCTISSSATAVTVSGGSATTILGGSGAGHVILDNAGVLGEVSSTVTVNGTACTLGSTCAPSSAATSITVGTTTVVSGSANALLAQSTSGATVAEITTGNNQTLITNGSGVSSFSATLPPAVQGNITSTGTLTGGATGAGFTIALTTSTVTGINVVTNGGTGLATLTAGAIYKGAGTSVVAVSALSDNGTIVSSSESFDLTSHAAISEIANASSTGTTVNKLAKLSGAPSTALITATTDTGGVVGVVVGGAGTTGNAEIAVSGQASCAFDGGTTAGDYAQISASVAGDCTDAGATYPTAHQVIGRVLATIASAGNAAIVVFPSEIEASTGGGGGGGTITSVAIIAGTGMQVAGSCTSTTSINCTINSPWSISGSDIYNNNAGNVGIGTSSPTASSLLTITNGTGSQNNMIAMHNTVGFGPCSVSANGDGCYGTGPGDGIQVKGQGSVADIGYFNKNGTPVLLVPTGTTNVELSAFHGYADLRMWGSLSCNPASPSSTNVAAATWAANVAGWTHFFIPAGCYWDTSQNASVSSGAWANYTIPAGFFVRGENWTQSGIAAGITQSLQLSAGVTLDNLFVQDSYCYGVDGGSFGHPAMCPVGHVVYLAAGSFVVYPFQPSFVYGDNFNIPAFGGNGAVSSWPDVATFGLQNSSGGDAIYAQQNGTNGAYGNLILNLFGATGQSLTLNSANTLSLYNTSGVVSVQMQAFGYLKVGNSSTSNTNPQLVLQNNTGTCSHFASASSEGITCSSDERLKENIAEASSQLSWLSSFNIRQFDLRSNGEHVSAGVVAQEVETTHPEMVRSGKAGAECAPGLFDGCLSVQEPSSWKMMKAMQEMQGEIVDLQSKVGAAK